MNGIKLQQIAVRHFEKKKNWFSYDADSQIREGIHIYIIKNTQIQQVNGMTNESKSTPNSFMIHLHQI